jgi:gluconolactonase
MDCAGNLYLTSGGRVHVRSPSGQDLGSIGGIQGGFITNVAFGGEDGKRLYVTSNTTLHEIQLEVPGFPN